MDFFYFVWPINRLLFYLEDRRLVRGTVKLIEDFIKDGNTEEQAVAYLEECVADYLPESIQAWHRKNTAAAWRIFKKRKARA